MCGLKAEYRKVGTLGLSAKGSKASIAGDRGNKQALFQSLPTFSLAECRVAVERRISLTA